MTANRPSGHMPRHRVLSRVGVRLWAMLGGSVLLVVALSLVAVKALDRPSATGRSDAASGAPAAATGVPTTAVPTLSPSPTAATRSPSRTPTPSPKANRTTRTETTGIGPNRGNCGGDPSGCGFPDASNTGVPAGTKLAVVNGDLEVRQAGAVVTGKDIRGCVRVQAKNVTIRRSKVTCVDFYAIASFSEDYGGGGLLVEDVEIDCKNTNGTGVGSYGFTARRLEIRGCENGFDVNRDATIVDSYIHDLYEGSSGHADGVQLAGGAHIDIRHNTIFVPGGTSAIISHPSDNSDVLVASNLMAGGAYTLYCPRDSSVDFHVLDNRFSTIYSGKSGQYGPWTDCEKAAQVRGNVWDRDLRPLAT
jgi:hypothetical protein